MHKAKLCSSFIEAESASWAELSAAGHEKCNKLWTQKLFSQKQWAKL
jgi:hypothetical protein